MPERFTETLRAASEPDWSRAVGYRFGEADGASLWLLVVDAALFSHPLPEALLQLLPGRSAAPPAIPRAPADYVVGIGAHLCDNHLGAAADPPALLARGRLMFSSEFPSHPKGQGIERGPSFQARCRGLAPGRLSIGAWIVTKNVSL
jgi:hypothetical protein